MIFEILFASTDAITKEEIIENLGKEMIIMHGLKYIGHEPLLAKEEIKPIAEILMPLINSINKKDEDYEKFDKPCFLAALPNLGKEINENTKKNGTGDSENLISALVKMNDQYGLKTTVIPDIIEKLIVVNKEKKLSYDQIADKTINNTQEFYKNKFPIDSFLISITEDEERYREKK